VKNIYQDIQHYGVKGMRWGIRKDPNRMGFFKRKSAQRQVKRVGKARELADLITTGRSYRDPAAELLKPQFNKLFNDIKKTSTKNLGNTAYGDAVTKGIIDKYGKDSKEMWMYTQMTKK